MTDSTEAATVKTKILLNIIAVGSVKPLAMHRDVLHHFAASNQKPDVQPGVSSWT